MKESKSLQSKNEGTDTQAVPLDEGSPGRTGSVKKRKLKSKMEVPVQEEVLPNLTGMSDAWKAFYRTVAKKMKE